MRSPSTHVNTIQEALDALRNVITCLRAGRFKHDDYAAELEHIWNALCKISTPCSRAKQQISILADMLDDGIGPKIDEERAKFVAGEIRKYLEWIP